MKYTLIILAFLLLTMALVNEMSRMAIRAEQVAIAQCETMILQSNINTVKLIQMVNDKVDALKDNK